MIPSVLLAGVYRVILGVMLLHGLWGTMGEGIALHSSHAWAEQNLMKEKEPENHHDHQQTSASRTDQWEGSPEGIAYSEFNHALVGIGVILIGLSELRTAIGWRTLAWLRWLLPVSLIGSGIFLLIWSDHEAWPIGSWTLAETVSGRDGEVLQHKIFGILALGVGIVEGFLRAGKITLLFWRGLLPGFALISSLMLFIHMHGPHPAGEHIQAHHHLMGTLALAGALAWFAAEWRPWPQGFQYSFLKPSLVLKIIWALCVLTIGLQLLFYSES
jgi:hypothetical protein